MEHTPSGARNPARRIDMGDELTVDALAARIREAATAGTCGPAVTHVAMPHDGLSSVDSIHAGSTAPTHDAWSRITQRLRDIQVNLDVVEEWVRGETEWNAASNQLLSQQVDELRRAVDAVTQRVDGVAGEALAFEERLLEELSSVRQEFHALRESMPPARAHSPQLGARLVFRTVLQFIASYLRRRPS